MLRLGGPEPHGRRSGVVHILAESERGGPRPRPAASPSLLGAQGSLDARPRSRTSTSRALLPESKKRAYDVHPLVEASSTRAPLGAARRVGAQHRHRARPLRRPHRRRDRQQPAAPRRLPRLAVGGEGRPLRADVRRVRRPADRARRRARLPARRRARSGTASYAAAPSCCTPSASASCPRVTLVTRKTYGGAYIAMNARSLGATKVFAWPGAEVAVMGAVAAVRILHRRKLPRSPPDLRPQVEAELAAEHERIAGGVEQGRRDRRGRRGRRAAARTRSAIARRDRRRGPEPSACAAAGTATSPSDALLTRGVPGSAAALRPSPLRGIRSGEP